MTSTTPEHKSTIHTAVQIGEYTFCRYIFKDGQVTYAVHETQNPFVSYDYICYGDFVMDSYYGTGE